MKFGPNTTPIYIPLDLQINILLRLHVKSLLRFQCVSKLWYSIITSHDFGNRHFDITSSSAAPRLLIAFQDFDRNELMLVSSPNPNTSSSSPSSCCVPYKDLRLLNINGRKVYNAVRGLICFESRLKVGICNPSTRELHIFPRVKLKRDPDTFPCIMYFLGYDPIGDKYKVLAIDNLPWRLEYKIVDKGSPNNSIIVSFDVRSETYKISNVPSKLLQIDDSDNFWTANCNWFIGDKTLINYSGKIGVVEKPRHGIFRMWVVEDAEKEEWSMNTFYLPQSAAGLDFKVMDTFYTGEICLVTEKISDPFCLFYYNLKTNSMRSVAIKGLPISEFKQGLQFHSLSVTVSDHYESLVSLET
ncbi:F-box family protein [Arabidopsis lyrata subsp. lyrata]|uniref:F-box family protein n=1 Tax=Arabidopsis lyrata subsp. lyrata TaxID=81972 RepID=D7LNB1_ARALL|nr:F-box family protein [Arabidopsis lyrata subsp. lyrata]